MPADEKEARIIRELHRRILSGTFDELDVYSLLILIREGAPKLGAIRELADFVAHRRKTKGHVHAYVQNTRTQLSKFARKEACSFTIAPVYTAQEVADDLNVEMNRHGLAAIPCEISNLVIFSILSLLQTVKLYAGKLVVGYLTINIDREFVRLMGAISLDHLPQTEMWFPALQLANDGYVEIPADKQSVSPTTALRIEVVAGQLAISETNT